jgi:hypothetical protein
VCGGRDYSDWVAADAVICEVAPELVIQGGASGADGLARRWAEERGIPCMTFPAAWDCYGVRAGPIRNKWMLEFGEPDLVLAFRGGAGTRDMVRQAEEKGVPVRKVGW